MTEGSDASTIALSIIIPTIGRPELSRLLAELGPQLRGRDEIIVVGDGYQPDARRACEGAMGGVKYLEYGPDHCWGHPQRNWAMGGAQGTHLMSFDDDDRCAPDSLARIKAAVRDHPGRPCMFRMYHDGTVLWTRREVFDGNVATQMFVTPNAAGRIGQWGRRYAGDYDFISSTLALYPVSEGALAWIDQVIAIHGTIASKAIVDHWRW